MEEPTIRVPVNCPACAQEHLCRLSIAAAAAALLSGDRLRLMCRRCHANWIATDNEREQIREYLTALDSIAAAGPQLAAARGG
jgi:hypothetical protein